MNAKDLPVAQEQTQQLFSLVPQNLKEAMELAKLIADSDLAPKDFKGKPGNVMIAVQMGQEVGLAPMAAIQNIAVINGKPSIYGDAGKAILLSKGFIIDEDDIAIVKKNNMTGRCKITRPGYPPIERTFTKENAVKAGLWDKAGPWTTFPERQLAWRAFWFAARDCASDVLKGLGGFEEIRDLERDITTEASHTIVPQPTSKSDAPAAAQTQGSATAQQDSSSGAAPDTSGEQLQESPPLKPSQVNIIRAKLNSANLTDIDLYAAFPDRTLEPPVESGPKKQFVLGDFNTIVKWIADNAK